MQGSAAVIADDAKPSPGKAAVVEPPAPLSLTVGPATWSHLVTKTGPLARRAVRSHSPRVAGVCSKEGFIQKVQEDGRTSLRPALQKVRAGYSWDEGWRHRRWAAPAQGGVRVL